MSASGYSVPAYGAMIADDIRTGAYAEALGRAVQPGDTVLDIGCGTGIFTLLACKYGARHVYAVEPSDAIALARQTVKANGYADRVTFYQDVSTRVTLPEKVDVVVSDLRGTLPLLQHHIPSIVDARQRHLRPGGALIPQCDRLWAVTAQANEVYRKLVGPWESERYGVDLSAGRAMVVNSNCTGRPERNDWLAEPQLWATLDYTSVTNPDVGGEVAVQASRAGMGHGIAVWFDATLFEDITICTAPDQPKLIYGNTFFPWAEPVSLHAGDSIKIDLRADLVGDEYVWQWNTRIVGREGEKAQFKQSTFFGKPMALSSLRSRAAAFTPRLDHRGEIERFVLSQMDGQTPLSEIAKRLSERYPADYPDVKRSLAYAGRLSAGFSQPRT